METRTGKRTAHVRVQIVEDGPLRITIFFDGEPQPLAFTPDERPTHFVRLQQILELHDQD